MPGPEYFEERGLSAGVWIQCIWAKWLQMMMMVMIDEIRWPFWGETMGSDDLFFGDDEIRWPFFWDDQRNSMLNLEINMLRNVVELLIQKTWTHRMSYSSIFKKWVGGFQETTFLTNSLGVPRVKRLSKEFQRAKFQRTKLKGPISKNQNFRIDID